MRVLVTGVAGFIGFHLTRKLNNAGIEVMGIDQLNDYYDISLKEARLELLQSPHFTFEKISLEDRGELERLFKQFRPEIVIHLAGQAGVRHSLKNPHLYIQSNVVGFTNIIEECQRHQVKHFIYASSSSVYGSNTKTPFSITDPVNHPVSLYAATKRANELIAHSYSHVYGLPTTGLRFFTVYGPWGRPDMAYFSFTKNIIEGKPIQVFNYGDLQRDFTYIDDVVEAIYRIVLNGPIKDTELTKQKRMDLNTIPYKLYNIGSNRPIQIKMFINTLENIIGKKAVIEYLPMQEGDVKVTYADISDLNRDIDFYPSTTLDTGLKRFVDWYSLYYNVDLS
jgi:UDP-glucuronate 4-epimerase